MDGLITKSTGSWYQVLSGNNTYRCRVKGKLRLKGFKSTNPLAVGDWVEFTLDKESEGIIHQIKARQNYILRKATKTSKESQIIAANIDQVIVMATVVYPRTSHGFIDRLTVTTESFRIPTIIMFNKIDILDEELKTIQNEMMAIYVHAGYECLSVSALKDHGLNKVHDLIKGKINLLTGHSGVGKSTLINHLSPGIDQKTAGISDFSQKGVHTTAFAEMFKIRDDTFIIDTPGIKEFGLSDIQDFELSDYFPEMRKMRGQCKYYDCQHTHEPKCAIRNAVESGDISPYRYRSYLSMLEDDDNRR